MLRLIQIIIVGIFTSFFFFPFVPTFLPFGNTKMIMAGLGLITLGVNAAKGHKASINTDIMNLSLIALLVSLISFIAVTVNETRDYVFVSYFISMWVWMAAAYCVLQLMKNVHGEVSVDLIGKYLVGVCVFQCLTALTMDMNASFKNIIDSIISGDGFMGKNEGRLYGIGCALDVAGIKFSAVLIILANIIGKVPEEKNREIKWHILSFLIITVIGNMISRTTIIGASLAILYILYLVLFSKFKSNANVIYFRKWFVVIFIVFLPFVVYLYNNNVSIHENLRFAFEGFFSLFETGKWQTHSNDILKGMVVFPDNMHTWIIGDGYFDGPAIVGSSSYDPYYIGRNYGYYYKGTDIGYLRYIFYYGVVGLTVFMLYFCKVTEVCMKNFKSYKVMFFMILIMNFLGWFKVSSDIFPAFAIFLVLSIDSNKENIETKQNIVNT